jgi:uncharacterized membrane protein
MSTKTTIIFALGLTVLSLVLSLSFMPSIPEQVATHWNQYGEADGFSSRNFGMYFMPGIQLAVLLILLCIPLLDPLRSNIEKFRPVYNGFILVYAGFMTYLHLLTLLWNTGLRFSMIAWMMPGFAALMFFTGTLLDKAKPNWFIGIRTPWTLSNPVVWEKTNRAGARFFKIIAVLSLVGVAFPDFAIYIMMIPLLLGAFGLIVLSYVYYRRESAQ